MRPKGLPSRPTIEVASNPAMQELMGESSTPQRSASARGRQRTTSSPRTRFPSRVPDRRRDGSDMPSFPRRVR